MVLGGCNKKPRYTVVVTPRETNGGSQPPKQQMPQMKPQMQSNVSKPNVVVKDVTIEQLISNYKISDDDDDEPLLPGFKYLKNMKTQLKTERVKSVLKRR